MGIVQQILKLISPALRDIIVTFARQFKITALKSENPVDDIAAYLLFLIIGIPWESK
ncbi:hypothetical protein ES705_25144 [subsurface metagenome]